MLSSGSADAMRRGQHTHTHPCQVTAQKQHVVHTLLVRITMCTARTCSAWPSSSDSLNTSEDDAGRGGPLLDGAGPVESAILDAVASMGPSSRSSGGCMAQSLPGRLQTARNVALSQTAKPRACSLVSNGQPDIMPQRPDAQPVTVATSVASNKREV